MSKGIPREERATTTPSTTYCSYVQPLIINEEFLAGINAISKAASICFTMAPRLPHPVLFPTEKTPAINLSWLLLNINYVL